MFTPQCSYVSPFNSLFSDHDALEDANFSSSFLNGDSELKFNPTKIPPRLDYDFLCDDDDFLASPRTFSLTPRTSKFSLAPSPRLDFPPKNDPSSAFFDQPIEPMRIDPFREPLDFSFPPAEVLSSDTDSTPQLQDEDDLFLDDHKTHNNNNNHDSRSSDSTGSSPVPHESLMVEPQAPNTFSPASYSPRLSLQPILNLNIDLNDIHVEVTPSPKEVHSGSLYLPTAINVRHRRTRKKKRIKAMLEKEMLARKYDVHKYKNIKNFRRVPILHMVGKKPKVKTRWSLFCNHCKSMFNAKPTPKNSRYVVNHICMANDNKRKQFVIGIRTRKCRFAHPGPCLERLVKKTGDKISDL